jgi:hypothetical protein
MKIKEEFNKNEDGEEIEGEKRTRSQNVGPGRVPSACKCPDLLGDCSFCSRLTFGRHLAQISVETLGIVTGL